MKVSSPIKYFGGKSYLAERICALLPPPETYHNFAELFSGGASVLFAHAHPGPCAEYLNDLNGEIENFWRVLREPDLFDAFVRTVQAVPFSERMFEGELSCAMPYGAHPVRRAVRFFVLNRLSRSADFKTFATLSKTRTRRGMSEQASAWLGAIEGLPEAHERLRGVVLLNRPAVAVIDALDDPKTVFYVDPPYMPETRAGKGEYENTPGGSGKNGEPLCEMDLAGHIELLEKLAAIKGKFLLSGYHSPLYDDCAEAYEWNCVEFETPLASAGGDTKRIATECLWRNYQNGLLSPNG